MLFHPFLIEMREMEKVILKKICGLCSLHDCDSRARPNLALRGLKIIYQQQCLPFKSFQYFSSNNFSSSQPLKVVLKREALYRLSKVDVRRKDAIDQVII